MRVPIEVSLTPERLVARVTDGTVTLDEPNLVALRESPKGRSLIVATGTRAEAMREGATVVPGLSIDAFDPAMTAAVVEFAGKHLWSLRRPQLGGIIGALDHVEVRVTIAGYADLLPASAQSQPSSRIGGRERDGTVGTLTGPPVKPTLTGRSGRDHREVRSAWPRRTTAEVTTTRLWPRLVVRVPEGSCPGGLRRRTPSWGRTHDGAVAPARRPP